MLTTIDKLFQNSKISDSTVIEILSLKKYKKYIDSLDWKSFCEMHIVSAAYGDLVSSEAYKLCRDFTVVDKYRKLSANKKATGAIVLIIDETDQKIANFVKVAKECLIEARDETASSTTIKGTNTTEKTAPKKKLKPGETVIGKIVLNDDEDDDGMCHHDLIFTTVLYGNLLTPPVNGRYRALEENRYRMLLVRFLESEEGQEYEEPTEEENEQAETAMRIFRDKTIAEDPDIERKKDPDIEKKKDPDVERTKKLVPGETKIGEIPSKDESGDIYIFSIYFGNLLVPVVNGKFRCLKEPKYREVLSTFLESDEGKEYVIPTEEEIQRAREAMRQIWTKINTEEGFVTGEKKKLEPGETKIGEIKYIDEAGHVTLFSVYFGNLLTPAVNGKFKCLKESKYRELLSAFLKSDEGRMYTVPTETEIKQANTMTMNCHTMC